MRAGGLDCILRGEFAALKQPLPTQRSVWQDPLLLTELMRRWLAVVVCLGAAVVVAYWVGTQQRTWLLLCVAVAVVAAVTGGLRQRAWVLIPLAWYLSGSSYLLPLPLSIRDVAVLLALCAYIGYRVLTGRDLRQKWHALDVVLAVNLVYLVFTFAHNPVGFRVFGSETVGGRPYVNIALAVMAYWVIVRLPDSVKMVSRIPYFIAAGAGVVALLNAIVYVFPQATPWLLPFYGGVDYSVFLRSVAEAPAIKRWSQIYLFGFVLVLVLCARYPPRTLFNALRPRFYVFALAMVCILASGFRNIMLWAIVALVIGSWFHRGWRELALASALAGLLIGGLVFGQGRLFQLPLPAQRALSFLPGQWSPVVVADAEGSTIERFKWWETVIKHRLIRDWWFGDGFGVKQEDYLLTALQASRHWEHMILTGGYHNGPLSAIRYTGIVGLTLFYAFMIAAAVYSVRCVNRCRGTPLQAAAIFVAIQLIWTPIHYTFVFGGYESQFPEHVFLVAVLRLLTRMSEEMRSSAPEVAPAMTRRPATARAAV